MSPAFTDVLISWAPGIVLIGVWIWVMRRLYNRKIPDKVVAEMQRQNETLDRIARALETRG